MADRYEIKGRLGRGGIGAVYQAFDHHLERDIAIKRLLPIEETKLNESAEKTLKLEAKALASLSHPNIVTIFEFGEDEQGPFVVFELIEGDTLKQVVKGGALTEVDFYDIGSQILDALVSAHEINLIHRDIKPLGYHRVGFRLRFSILDCPSLVKHRLNKPLINTVPF